VYRNATGMRATAMKVLMEDGSGILRHLGREGTGRFDDKDIL
jgi:hypothetical protein